MRVSDALAARKSIRNFLDTPVPDELIAALLEKAARAAPGLDWANCREWVELSWAFKGSHGGFGACGRERTQVNLDGELHTTWLGWGTWVGCGPCHHEPLRGAVMKSTRSLATFRGRCRTTRSSLLLLVIALLSRCPCRSA